MTEPLPDSGPGGSGPGGFGPGGFGPGGHVLCAVSGGADSIALLHLCWSLRQAGRLAALDAAHFHHGLRAAADQDERFVRAFCAERGIVCHVGRGDTEAAAQRRRMGLEEAARALRYEFLERTAKETGADAVLTAHTADDNLETLLLNLTRGTGLDGLCGIPPKRGLFARPLLGWTRGDVLQYLDKHGLSYRVDESNADPRFRRNRLRREVLPVLREMNPAVAEAAGRAAGLLRADADYLRSLADAELAAYAETSDVGGVRFPAARIRGLPWPVAARVLRALCGEAGFRDAASLHVAAMLALCGEDASPHAAHSLPGGLSARRVYDDLCVGPDTAPALPSLSLNITDIGPYEDANIYKTFNSFFVADDTIVGNIRLRTRQSGDKIALAGGGGTRTLKKLMIDRKIPQRERDAIPVAADSAGVIFVAGLGVDRSRLPHPGARVLRLDMVENAE